MKTPAAVLVETGRPLALAELDIPPLKPGQVLVEIAFSGVCRTQILESRGYRGADPHLPHCLGHEGSGVVRELGQDVAKVRTGDEVILSWITGSGADVSSTTYRWGSRTVNSGAITTFSKYAVISENRLTVKPAGLPMRDAAMVGCAVATGVGAVLNAARPRPGQSLAVFGTGGIGLCAVAGAAVAGCSPIIAVDIRRDMLDLADVMGATHLVDAAASEPVAEVVGICPGGVAFAIEASGLPHVMLQSLASVRAQGGIAVVVGNARHDETVALDPRQLNMGKRLFGTWGGDSNPDRDYPKYAELITSGKLNLTSIASEAYPLNAINDALDDMEAGRAARPLIDMTSE